MLVILLLACRGLLPWDRAEIAEIACEDGASVSEHLGWRDGESCLPCDVTETCNNPVAEFRYYTCQDAVTIPESEYGRKHHDPACEDFYDVEFARCCRPVYIENFQAGAQYGGCPASCDVGGASD